MKKEKRLKIRINGNHQVFVILLSVSVLYILTMSVSPVGVGALTLSALISLAMVYGGYKFLLEPVQQVKYLDITEDNHWLFNINNRLIRVWVSGHSISFSSMILINLVDDRGNKYPVIVSRYKMNRKLFSALKRNLIYQFDKRYQFTLSR